MSGHSGIRNLYVKSITSHLYVANLKNEDMKEVCLYVKDIEQEIIRGVFIKVSKF